MTKRLSSPAHHNQQANSRGEASGIPSSRYKEGPL